MWINYRWSFSQTQQSNSPPKNLRAHQVFPSCVSTRAWGDEPVDVKRVKIYDCIAMAEILGKSTLSPNVRESKTVLDSEFHPVDSGFQSLVGFPILGAVFWIPKPRILRFTSLNFLDFGLHKQKFPAIRNPDSLYTWSLGCSPSTVHDSYENMLYYDLKALISFILPFI